MEGAISDCSTCSVLQVAVNGAHLLEYKHRVELERIDTLSVSGKVQVEAIGVLPRAVSHCECLNVC